MLCLVYDYSLKFKGLKLETMFFWSEHKQVYIKYLLNEQKGHTLKVNPSWKMLFSDFIQFRNGVGIRWSNMFQIQLMKVMKVALFTLQHSTAIILTY